MATSFGRVIARRELKRSRSGSPSRRLSSEARLQRAMSLTKCWCWALLLVTLALPACRESTSLEPSDIPAHRTLWQSQRLSDYAYDYEVTGFFINYEGKVIHLTVRADTVRSAVFVATGQPVGGSPATFPTINGLFDRAEAAVRANVLTDILFDPRTGFPLRMDLAGPPDASGSVFASHLEPFP